METRTALGLDGERILAEFAPHDRAEAFKVLRRVPVPGYDVSFLVTHEHVEDMLKPKLVDFIVQLLEDVDREISEQKLSVSSRGRVVAADFLKSFA